MTTLTEQKITHRVKSIPDKKKFIKYIIKSFGSLLIVETILEGYRQTYSNICSTKQGDLDAYMPLKAKLVKTINLLEQILSLWGE